MIIHLEDSRHPGKLWPLCRFIRYPKLTQKPEEVTCRACLKKMEK